MHPSMYVKKISQIGVTEISIRKFLAMLTRNTALKGIYTLPTEAMFKKIYPSRMKPILETDSIFNPPGETPALSASLIQIRASFGDIEGHTAGESTTLEYAFLFHEELELDTRTKRAYYTYPT